jgi:uncharacterized protein YggE
MQDSILTNRNFIKAATVLVVLLSVFVLALFINQIRVGSHSPYGPNQQIPSITVSGSGDVMAVSDIATISITVSKDATTSAQAQKDLNDSVTKTLEYLKSQNIDDKDIKSEYGGLNPKYAYDEVVCVRYPCPPTNQKIVGYTATQSITVKIRAVDTANDIRTGLANLGLTNISGPDFSIDEDEMFKDQARAKAIDDAREKAEVLAKQLHVHLGNIVSYSENGGSLYPMMYSAKEMSAGMAMDASVPPAPALPKGENKITSNVTIVYEIR